MQATSRPDRQKGTPGDEDEIVITDEAPARDTVVGRPPRAPESALLREIDEVIQKLDARKEDLERSIADAERECTAPRRAVQVADENRIRAQEELGKARLEASNIEREKSTLERIQAIHFKQPSLSVQLDLQALMDDHRRALEAQETKFAKLVEEKDRAYSTHKDALGLHNQAVSTRRLSFDEIKRANDDITQKLSAYEEATREESEGRQIKDEMESFVSRIEQICRKGSDREQDIINDLGAIGTRLKGALDFQTSKQTALETADSNVTRARTDLQEHETALQELRGNLTKLDDTSKVLRQAFEIANRGEDAVQYTEGLLARLGQVHARYAETNIHLDEQTLALLETVRGVRERVQKALCEGDGKIFGLQELLVARSRNLTDILERLSRAVTVFAQAPNPESEAEFADGIRESLGSLQGLVRSPMDNADTGTLERDAGEIVDVTTRSVNDIDPAALRKEVKARDELVERNKGLSAALQKLQGEEIPRLGRLTDEERTESERLRGQLAKAATANEELRTRITELERTAGSLDIVLKAAGVETAAELRDAIDILRDASRGFRNERALPSLPTIATGLATSMRRAVPDRTPEGAGSS